MADLVTGALQVDLKRRTTLPGDILAAAGIPPGSPLVARVEEPGRIVLESPQLLLTLLQDDIAAALDTDPELDAEAGASLVEQLLTDRADDTSLDERAPRGEDSEPPVPPVPGAAEQEGRP